MSWFLVRICSEGDFMQVEYRSLQDGEITSDLFANFIRHQVVNDLSLIHISEPTRPY